MENKLISIVLPVYNGEKFLRDSIDSIINQTYKNWELIIVNDCSTDNSLKIAQEYANLDKRIKVISNETNKKLPASLNIGFKEAKGEYLTWTSDDNMYKPKALEKMYNFLEQNKEYIMVCAKFEKIINDNIENIYTPKPIPENMIFECSVGACFLYRRNVLDLVGEYDTQWFLVEDYEYWLRVCLIGKIGVIYENLYTYRLHDACLSTLRSYDVLKNTKLVQDKYFSIYLEKFPEVKNERDKKMLDKVARLPEHGDIKSLNDNYDKKVLYKAYKDAYKNTKNKIYLKAIRRLGLKYRIKSLILKFKYKNIKCVNNQIKTYEERLSSDEWGNLFNVSMKDSILNRIKQKDLTIQTQEILKITDVGSKVLEIASGTGESSVSLALYNNCKCVALDYEKNCVELIQELSKSLLVDVKTLCLDATKLLPFKENEFDVIFHAGLLEHFTKDERIAMLKHWYPYGKKMISMVPNASSLAYRIGKKNMEDSGTWQWGLEMPIHSQIDDFTKAGYIVEKEYTIGLEQALNFLENGILKQTLLESIANGYEDDQYYQGYLLVTIGVKHV